MKKFYRLFAISLFLFCLAASVQATDFNVLRQKIDSVGNFGQQFENNEISYPQLVVLSKTIAQEVREELLQQTSKEGGFKEEILSENVIRELFGGNSGFTNWVWVKNEKKAVRIQQQLPYWQKALFDGRKTRITATILPQAVNAGEKTVFFYDFVFNIRPKTFQKPSLESISTEIRTALLDYNSGKDTRIVDLALEQNAKIKWYIEDSSVGNDCGVVQELIGEYRELSFMELVLNLREFEQGKIVMKMNWCENNCENQEIGANIIIEFNTWEHYIPPGNQTRFSSEDFNQFSEEELKDLISQTLQEIKSSETSIEFLKKVRDESAPKIDAMFHALSKKGPSNYSWAKQLATELAVGKSIIENPYTRRIFEQDILNTEEGRAAFYADCTIKPNGTGGSSGGIIFQKELFHTIGVAMQEKRFDTKSDCSFYLQSFENHRNLLQQIDNKFLEWFLDSYVSANEEKWWMHASTINALHNNITDNTREIVRQLDCLQAKELPSGLKSINAEFSSRYGSIKIWEKNKTAKVFETAQERIVPSTYLEMQLLPPKPELKKSISKALLKISERDISARIEADPELKNNIAQELKGKKVSQLVNYKDGEEVFASIMITVDENNILLRQAQATENADIRMGIDIEFIYSIMKVTGKPKTFNPPWESEKPVGLIEKTGQIMELTLVVLEALVSGKLSVEPITVLPATIASANKIAESIARFA